MTSLARLVALILAANALLLASALVYATGQPEVGAAMGIATLVGFAGGAVMAAGSIPRHRIPNSDRSARTGLSGVIAGGLEILLGAAYIGLLGHLLSGTIWAVVGVVMATLGAGMLNEARVLRLVPSLTSHDEEPRALALGANAMPGRARSLVVATDGRIVWAEGRRMRERHALRLEDVDRFDVDYRTGTLVVVGGREALRVRPVPKPELEKFERLLRGRAASRVPS